MRCLQYLPHLRNFLLVLVIFDRSFLDLLVFVLQCCVGLELSLDLGASLLLEFADLRVHLCDHLEELLLELFVYLHHAIDRVGTGEDGLD